MTQQQRREAPALAGVLDVASELGSPATIGTVAATAGIGEAGVIPKVLSGLFAGQIATSVYDQYPALKDAVNRAQTAKTKEAHDDAFADAQRILTHMGADTVMGLLPRSMAQKAQRKFWIRQPVAACLTKRRRSKIPALSLPLNLKKPTPK